MADPIDFSQTQRIVLLIDVNPLFHHPNPIGSSYIASILASAEILTGFPPLSSSLFTFRLFFSSLSPLLSSSRLHSLLPSASLSFHRPSQTLSSLTRAFTSLPTLFDVSLPLPNSPPRASLVAQSLLQLVHDYGWEHLNHDPLGMFDDPSPFVRSNLVVLFSPIARSLECLSQYLNADMGDELSMNAVGLSRKICSIFGPVNDAFMARDICCSWVDVQSGIMECDQVKASIEGPDEVKLGSFENGMKALGWGFCSTESIVLGSALVPFGLIYPNISGALPSFLKCTDFRKAFHAQLSLQILDVNEKLIECKCCDLEMFRTKMMCRHGYDDIFPATDIIETEISWNEQQKSFWEQFDHGVVKLHIRAVQRYDTFKNIQGSLHDVILVRGSLGKPGKEQNEHYSEFFADRVLEMLSTKSSEAFRQNSIPIWQLFLSFLYREGYWALVSLSHGNGNSCMGILKPFTIYSALISVEKNGFLPQHMEGGLRCQNSTEFVEKTNKVCMPSADTEPLKDPIDSQSRNLKKHVSERNSKSKRAKKQSHLLKDLDWNTFCKAAFEHTMLVLEELYFAKLCNSSKKLKFLKCWTKQVKKSNSYCFRPPDVSQHHEVIAKEIEERLTTSNEESEQPVSTPVLIGEHFPAQTRGMQEQAVTLSFSESSEAFFSGLPEKIQHGLESEVDLGALAERLVNSSIHLLNQKRETDADSESQTSLTNSGHTSNAIVAKVTKLFLKEPKDLVAKHKASDSESTLKASENTVREYELQIFFRMEILQSQVAVSTKESAKQKFVKQICSLLEIIQCRLEGGFFGDFSLDDYMGRNIKSRYSHTLRDVVERIYKKMDLLLFEDESINPSLNSEDSNQSWRDKLGKGESGEKDDINNLISVEDEASQPLGKGDESCQAFDYEEHVRKLSAAQERRERARRFDSFTSWVPDLQRVWAPKHPMGMRAKPDPLQKQRKRKDRKRSRHDTVCETPMSGEKRPWERGNDNGSREHGGFEIHSSDSVCETPLTGKKRSCKRGNDTGVQKNGELGMRSSGSVYKALFQDD